MVSEFRKKKFLFLYNFYDTDSSGVINKKDFDLAIDYVAGKQGWDKDGLKYKQNQELLAKVWENLQKEADADGDGEITLQEWYDMWEQFVKNPSSPFEWQKLYCKHIFDIEDASGDGAIDIEEYSTVIHQFGSSKEDAKTAFKKLAKGKPTISWEEFQELWIEYFTSENPSDPGNYIFGLCEFCSSS